MIINSWHALYCRCNLSSSQRIRVKTSRLRRRMKASWKMKERRTDMSQMDFRSILYLCMQWNERKEAHNTMHDNNPCLFKCIRGDDSLSIPFCLLRVFFGCSLGASCVIKELYPLIMIEDVVGFKPQVKSKEHYFALCFVFFTPTLCFVSLLLVFVSCSSLPWEAILLMARNWRVACCLFSFFPSLSCGWSSFDLTRRRHRYLQKLHFLISTSVVLQLSIER